MSDESTPVVQTGKLNIRTMVRKNKLAVCEARSDISVSAVEPSAEPPVIRIVEIPSHPKTVEAPNLPKTVEIANLPKTVEIPSHPKAVEIPNIPKAVEIPSPVVSDGIPSPAKIPTLLKPVRHIARPPSTIPITEPPRQEPSRQEPPRQEPPRQELPRQELPRQQAPRQELPRQQAPRQEPPRKELPPPRIEPDIEEPKESSAAFQYIVEEDSKKDAFLKKVNARVANGWVLQGGLSVDWNYPPGIVAAYRQALVKYG